MDTSRVKIILIVLIIAGSNLYAADKPEAAFELGSRDARHMVMPFVGYQNLEAEQVGFSYEYDWIDNLERDTTHIAQTGDFERTKGVPELGLIYRYRPMEMLSLECTFSLLLTKENIEHPISYEFRDYTPTSFVLAERSATKSFSAGVIFNIPTGISWMTPSVHLNGGYAWRNVNVKTRFTTEEGSVKDTESMYSVRAGLDVTIWSAKNFLLETSVYYTTYLDTKGDVDPFGGLGWRVGVFPLWSSSRNK